MCLFIKIYEIVLIIWGTGFGEAGSKARDPSIIEFVPEYIFAKAYWVINHFELVVIGLANLI
jgi:hypothetical protein